jgi:hypothetical protein
VNITNFSNAEANWINIHAAYQKVYNNIKDISPAPTPVQQDLAKREWYFKYRSAKLLYD